MAQSLIEQLQLGAVDGAAPITDLLRKAKLAAVKLDTVEFAAWIDLEMNGYSAKASVPAYRHVPYVVRFFNPYHGWQPVFGADGNTTIRQPVESLFALSQAKTYNSHTMNVPERFREGICRQLGFQCEVKMHISPTSVGGIVEAVRNHVLEWTLKLEKAGIRGDGLTFTREETKAAQSISVTNNYHGPVASVAHGSNTIHTVSQTNVSATPHEIADAVAALLEAIRCTDGQCAVAPEAVEDFDAAETDLREGRVPFGKLAKGIELLQKGSDLAIRAPEVMSRLHQLARMIGLA